MDIHYGEGETEYGPGIQINLTGEEVAMAIYTYLMAHKVIINGPATIYINKKLIKKGKIYVDPSGHIMTNGERMNGNGKGDNNN